MIERGILYIVDASINSVKQNASVLLKYLNRARYEPYLVISSDAHIRERLLEAQVDYKVIPDIANAGKLNINSVTRKIIQCIDERPINLIHSHGYQGCFVGNHVARQLNTPHVCTIHSGVNAGNKKKGLFAIQNEKVVTEPNHLIAVSEGVKNSLSSLNEVTVIHNAIEADRFAETLDTEHLTRELELNKDDVLVGTITNITSDEEINILLDVAKLLIANNEKLRFAIAGSGQDRKTLKNKMEDMGIGDKVYLLGYRRDVAHVLKSLDVVLIPNTKIGVPMVLMEALAGIRPVVAVDTPEIREFVTEDSAKFANSNDPKDLAEAIEYMLKNSVEAASKASAGHKIVVDRFTVDQMMKPTQSLYLKIAG